MLHYNMYVIKCDLIDKKKKSKVCLNKVHIIIRNLLFLIALQIKDNVHYMTDIMHHLINNPFITFYTKS
jgi:hypothetical protein